MHIPVNDDGLTVRLASFNIRYGNPDKVTLEESLARVAECNPLERPEKYHGGMRERLWSERRIPLVEELLWNNVDLICMQEVLYNQLLDIEKLFQMEKAKFLHVGVGRSDGLPDNSGPRIPGNEFNPIFFSSSSCKLKSFDTFWLSDTPFAVSKAEGTNCYRICGTGVFDTAVGDVTIMSTHWDNDNDTARALGASLILQRAAYEVERCGRPIFLMGDFNSETQFVRHGHSRGYEIMWDNYPEHIVNAETLNASTGARQPVTIDEAFLKRYPVKSAGFAFKNLIRAAPPRRVSGNNATFTGFNSVHDSKAVEKDFTQIDFILGGNNGGWACKAHRHGDNFYDNGLLFSDHRPVFADVKLLPGSFLAGH